jgi:hypothetical protein
MQCQIVVLQMQSKRSQSKAAMQRLHDVCQNFVIYFRCFWRCSGRVSLFWPIWSYFASAEYAAKNNQRPGKPLANVPFSC